MLMLKIVLLVGLLKLLYETQQPLLCAGIYGAGGFAMSLVFGVPLLPATVIAGIGFACALLYFWLLTVFSDGIPHWGILIGGLFIGLI
jgi:hypothetical protein